MQTLTVNPICGANPRICIDCRFKPYKSYRIPQQSLNLGLEFLNPMFESCKPRIVSFLGLSIQHKSQNCGWFELLNPRFGIIPGLPVTYIILCDRVFQNRSYAKNTKIANDLLQQSLIYCRKFEVDSVHCWAEIQPLFN